MALINRLSRLFRADFHAVLDRIEEPDVLLKQALREMEEDIQNDEQRLKFLQHELSLYDTKRHDVEEHLQQIEQELDICFDSNEDQLARSQVKRKVEMQRYKKHLCQKYSSTEKNIKELITRIQENKSRLSAMQQKLEVLTEESRVENDEFFINPNMVVHDDDIEVAFLREKQARKLS